MRDDYIIARIIIIIIIIIVELGMHAWLFIPWCTTWLAGVFFIDYPTMLVLITLYPYHALFGHFIRLARLAYYYLSFPHHHASSHHLIIIIISIIYSIIAISIISLLLSLIISQPSINLSINHTCACPFGIDIMMMNDISYDTYIRWHCHSSSRV